MCCKGSQAGKRIEDAIRISVREAWKGNSPKTLASPILGEYLNLQRLAKLGITADINKFDPELIEAFSMVASEISKQEEADRRKREAKRGT